MLDDITVRDALDYQLETDFIGCIDSLIKLSSDFVAPVQQATAKAQNKASVLVYWNPCLLKISVYGENGQDRKLVKEAILQSQAGKFLDIVDRHPNLSDWWVKVAESPLIRRIGNSLYFFSDSNPESWGARPLASTVASAVLGAGLGYGSGALADWWKGDSEYFDQPLRRNWAILGGLGGAALGAAPGAANLIAGKNFNDPNIFRGSLSNEPLHPIYDSPKQNARAKKSEDLAFYFEKEGFLNTTPFLMNSSFADSRNHPIQTRELGNVLSEVHPRLAQATLGLTYGASRFPDPFAAQDEVSPHQMGMLGLSMRAAGGGLKGYMTGYAAGKALGVLTGMSEKGQSLVRQGGLVAGVLQATVPKMFQG
jgi:hypothetical protein